MSKLSAQCDELRSMAASVGLAVPQAATLMMGAADTIDRLDAENAKLREYATKLEQANIVLGSDNCDLKNDMRDMQFFIDENRKLREYAKLMHGHIKECCDACGERDICDVDALTRSLRIEVG